MGRQRIPETGRCSPIFVDDRVFYAGMGAPILWPITLEHVPSLIQTRLKNHLSLKNLVVKLPNTLKVLGRITTASQGATMSLEYRCYGF